jgi:hypothetical protein
VFHSVTFKSDKYHRSIGGYDFSGYYIQFLRDPIIGKESGNPCLEVFQQDGMVSSVDGVNIQSSPNLYNRIFTILLYLWKSYEKGLPEGSPFKFDT